MYIPCTKAACLTWAWGVDSPPLHFTAQHLNVSPETSVQLLWQSRKRGALPGRNPSFPLQDGFLGYNAIPWHYLTISNSSYQFGTVLFISIIIFDTYILAADTYYCLWHWVTPSLMAQPGSLPAPAAEPGLGSTAGLELQGAQTRQPAAKPLPHRLLQHYNWCYSEKQSNSSGNIPCVFKKKKKKITCVLEFHGVTFWPKIKYINSSDICNQGQGF